jgi:exopolysaccharide biosynthesis protein
LFLENQTYNQTGLFIILEVKMNYYIRKSLAITLVAVIMLVSMFGTAYAAPNLIYEIKSEATPVTSGAVHETYKRFTDDGWININVLKVDISNPNVKIDTMINTENITTAATTKSLAESKGAIAAINGGFFEWPTKITKGIYIPASPIVSQGQLLTAVANYNAVKDTYATLSIDELNQVVQNYWRVDMQLVTTSGSALTVGRYNKQYYGFKDLTIYDRKWSAKSVGTDTPIYGIPDIVEMVVVDGIVTDIRQKQPAVETPQNGYVVITRSGDKMDEAIINNFKIGDQVTLVKSTTPDWTKMKTVIHGGTVLVNEGNIVSSFSHIPEAASPNAGGTSSSRNPRTAVGSSKDGKTMFLVTVDGRQAGGSIGATLKELAQIMKDLGAYYAVNLDGGGSTTMVSRTPGTNDLNVENSLSDGSMRRINNAIGVFSTAEPTNELSGMFIDTEDDNIFINTSRAFTVRGFDNYYNPVTVDPKNIKWSVSGVKGTFKDNVFYPTSLGRGKIKATVDKISKEIEISVLSSPVQLVLNKNTVKLSLNESTSFTVKGKNKNGYYAAINPADVKWTVKGGIGTFAEGKFTAVKQGAGYIDAAIEKTHVYCTVSVQVEKTAVSDKFEESGNTFLTYPSTVPGSYEISTDQKHSGQASGKITYDFSNTEDDRAAYIVLKNEGLTLSSNSSKIGMWVYNDHENSNWLGAWVSDSKGKQHTVYFTKELNWTGWKYVEASLEDIDSPAKLLRVYMVQPNPVADVGAIYIDDLSITTSSYPSIDMSKIPKDTVPADESNKSVTYKKSSSSFRFTVFGQSIEPKNPLEKLLVTNLVKRINSTYEASAFVGESSHKGAKTVKKTLIATNTGYKSVDISNSRLIQLDMSKNGLRTTNAAQWHWLLDQLNTAKGDNIFLFMSESPDSFSDSKESKLFKNILTEYKKKLKKNIWVFYKGEKNTSTMEEGIKYISTTGYEVNGLNQKTTNLAKYIVVTVKGSTVTYDFKSIV